jgi:predicted nucleotidyltransferase
MEDPMRTIQEIDLKAEDRRAVMEASKRLRDIVPIEKIIIFGSKVKGKDDDISDVDILILTARPVTWQEKSHVIRLLSRIGRQFDVLFDPVIHSMEEWEKGIQRLFPIWQEIENDGILVA